MRILIAEDERVSREILARALRGAGYDVTAVADGTAALRALCAEDGPQRVEEAERALAHIKRLQGLLPICSYCKRIRKDTDYWQEIELYIRDHSEADFSHGICPACYETVVEKQIAEHEKRRKD